MARITTGVLSHVAVVMYVQNKHMHVIFCVPGPSSMAYKLQQQTMLASPTQPYLENYQAK